MPINFNAYLDKAKDIIVNAPDSVLKKVNSALVGV
ncbi:MAG: hypothetical protein JWO03_2995 [Bacteroidetes bacterium]|nr:hypothetical protein [Bacteroidota bacterium]